MQINNEFVKLDRLHSSVHRPLNQHQYMKCNRVSTKVKGSEEIRLINIEKEEKKWEANIKLLLKSIPLTDSSLKNCPN